MSTTYGLASGAIENDQTLVSLDNGSAFSDGNDGSPVYDTGDPTYDSNIGSTTSDDSFYFGGTYYDTGAAINSPYEITWGDASLSATDEVRDITLDYSGVTLTQAVGAGQLIVDGSIDLEAGTIDLGNSGEIRFENSSAEFILNGVLQGSGSVDRGGPAMIGNGTIIAINNGYSLLSIGSDVGSGISAEVTSGADLDFGGSVQAGVTITVGPNSSGIVGIDDLQDFNGTIRGLTVNADSSNGGSYINLTNYAPSDIVATSVVGNEIIITGATRVLGTINIAGDTGKYADWTADTSGNGGTDLYLSDSVCFVAGTRILTQKGEVAVEAISAGDEVVVVVDGERVVRPVKWVGYRRLDLTRQKDAATLAPIRFPRGCLGEDLPKRDLLVSPPHGMFMDGKLIPAKLLVNNMTIYRDTDRASVEYYHIELDQHAIIIAEGVETESYLDTGNRAFFSNAGLALILHPEFHVNAGLRCWETDACAPLAVSPASVQPVWETIAARAEALGYQRPQLQTTSDADIHVIADGRRLDPVAVSGRDYTFIIPAGVSAVHLASRSVVPSEVTQYLDDRRELGVGLRKLSVRSNGDVEHYAADHPAFTQGWHAAERGQGAIWRWSNGCGKLPVSNTKTPTVLVVTISDTITYLLDGPRQLYRRAA